MTGVFDIIGPIMVGPSSSHTAGAVNIGRVARQILNCKPYRVEFTLYGSFAQTYKGHGTDRALVAGILGMTTDDPRIKNSLAIAKNEGIYCHFKGSSEPTYHPNTVRVGLNCINEQFDVVGISIGGGRIIIKEIDKVPVNITGEYHTLICSYTERLGMVSKVSSVLAAKNINIAFMKVSRDEAREKALMVVEVDEPLHDEIIEIISRLNNILHVKYIEKIEL
ncbi:MAG: L-serine ammonia-lyase, iron-sulfur-dependent subunit beta [Bacillota bacterium]